MTRGLIAFFIIIAMTIGGYFLFAYIIGAVFNLEQTLETKKEVVEQEKQQQAEQSVLEDLRRILTERREIPAEAAKQTPIATLTEDNRVIAPSGTIADNATDPGSTNAPLQSSPLGEEGVQQIKDDSLGAVIEMTMELGAITPSGISVRKGDLVTFIVSSKDQYTHVFAFEDPDLQGVAVGLGAGETRSITFNAPTKSGEYVFSCNVPGHRGQGEWGILEVK